MKVLCIYPGMNPVYNDNFHALRYLREQGVELEVLAGSVSGLKSSESARPFEVANGIPIHRRWSSREELNALSGRSLQDAEEIGDALRPDVIWCSLIDNRGLGRHLARRYDVPWIQLTESLFDAQMLMGRRMRWWRRLRLEAGARRLRRELLDRSDLIVHSNPGEIERASRLEGRARVAYVPWCSEVPDALLDEKIERRNVAIHIGSLFHFKNAQRLPFMVERLRAAGVVDRIEIVGSGTYQPAIEKLVEQRPESLDHTVSLTRSDSIRRLRSARFAFTPTRIGGWGLFGDCWAAQTPVLSLHDPYVLRHGIDAYCIGPREDPGEAARRLCGDPLLYESIQRGGLDRYRRDHAASVVGAHYLRLLRETVGR